MLNSSQLTKRREARTVYADFISQQERVAQGCAFNTAYSQGGLDSSTRLEILQGQIYTPSTTTAAILSNSACPGCNLPPVPSYLGSITVPSLPLSNIGGTQLLLLANSNAPFLDSSSNNYPLDNVNGGVTWASNGPPV